MDQAESESSGRPLLTIVVGTTIATALIAASPWYYVTRENATVSLPTLWAIMSTIFLLLQLVWEDRKGRS